MLLRLMFLGSALVFAGLCGSSWPSNLLFFSTGLLGPWFPTNFSSYFLWPGINCLLNYHLLKCMLLDRSFWHQLSTINCLFPSRSLCCCMRWGAICGYYWLEHAVGKVAYCSCERLFLYDFQTNWSSTFVYCFHSAGTGGDFALSVKNCLKITFEEWGI